MIWVCPMQANNSTSERKHRWKKASMQTDDPSRKKGWTKKRSKKIINIDMKKWDLSKERLGWLNGIYASTSNIVLPEKKKNLKNNWDLTLMMNDDDYDKDDAILFYNL